MSLYLVLYILIISFSLYIWCIVFKKYNNLSWLFFLLFSVSLSLWFFLYFLTFFTTYNVDLLLLYSKLAFWISIIWLYSFLFFILFFAKKNSTFFNKKSIIISIGFLFILFLYLKTPYIIESMFFNEWKQDYYETPWILFNLHIILSLLFFPLLLIISYVKLKSLNFINKERLKYILFWVVIFIWLGLFFQLILPLFDIRLFEKEIIFFILPFLSFTLYSISRYHFTDLFFRFSEVLPYILSIFFTVLIFLWFKLLNLSFNDSFIKFWGISSDFSYTDLIFWIITFIFLHKILSKYLPWNIEYNIFISKLNKLKEEIPFITSLDSLNNFLRGKALNLFGIKYVQIRLFKDNIDYKKQIYLYFKKDINRDVFINDIVFIEENKNKFNKKIIKKELNKKIAIVFPMIDNKRELIWVFELWYKPFKEYFFSEEIGIIKDFVSFLVWHIKYLDIYSKINDLNINLDKKVDKEVIKYNQLLNNQTEFISMASHEIKSPIWSAIFQIDYILDEISDWKISYNFIKKELDILNSSLIKVWNLANKIFSVQKYDLDKIELYRQNTDIKEYLNNLIFLFSKTHKNIDVELYIDNEVWFLNIDKVQFTQVIDNLLNNALKFADKNKSKIYISLKKKDKLIILNVEDNWKWFKEGESQIIFEKYNSWYSNSVWIWLGLYLCKSIVELHWWVIIANNSLKLWWAKITISIPEK